MKSHLSSRGFTLIEVIVAITILVGMGTGVAIYFTTGIRAKETIEAESEKYRMLHTAMDRMCREIAAAYVSDRYDLTRFRDANDRPTNFIGERSRLLFTSLSNQRLYQDAKESDQMVVEYSVKSSRARQANGQSDLIRRYNTLLDGKMDRGGTEDVLYEGIRRIEFAYWDSIKQEWDDEWDTRRAERKANLPSRVKVTLYALDESGKETQYTTQTRIMLNTEIPRYQ